MLGSVLCENTISMGAVKISYICWVRRSEKGFQKYDEDRNCMTGKGWITSIALIVSIAACAFFVFSDKFLDTDTSSLQDEGATQPQKIKIFVCYHKPFDMLSDKDIFVPIHVGRALGTGTPFHVGDGLKMNIAKDASLSDEGFRWLLDNAIGDDTGDNISLQNRRYCELSAVYWIWKNYKELDDLDYVGLMHYRRHFIFRPDYKLTLWERVRKFFSKNQTFAKVKRMDDAYEERFGLNRAAIQKAIANYDIVVSAQHGLLTSVYRFFKEEHHVTYLDATLKVLQEKYPEYGETVKECMKASSGNFGNMFIMKPAAFKEYCEFVFSITQETERLVGGAETRSAPKHAYAAYTIETLWLIWIAHQRKIGKYRIMQLPRTWVENTNLTFQG
jgi:hypothetical protein